MTLKYALDLTNYEVRQKFLRESEKTVSAEEIDLLSKVYLPKWPQFLVTGEKVSEEQAIEFIMKTDSFFLKNGHTGNNRSFERKLCDLFGLIHSDDISEIKDMEKMLDAWEKNRERAEELSVLRLEFLKSGFLSSGFVGGPHGLVHPNGEISYSDNIGSYPSAESIFLELRLLALNFPFLSLEGTLFNGEAVETDRKPVVSFIVDNGTVRIVDPAVQDVHLERREKSIADLNSGEKIDSLMENLFQIFSGDRLEDGRTRENAISYETCVDYLNKLKTV